MKQLKSFALCALCIIALTTVQTMAFNLEYDITIGKYSLQAVESVEIETSQELLSNQCKITLPGMVAGSPVEIEDKIKRGDQVTVKLGYNSVLQTEFEGYLKAIYPGAPLVLEFEDGTYLFRKSIKNKVFTNVGIRKIFDYVLSEVNPQLTTPFKLVTDLSADSYKWERFAIQDATGWEVLDKLRQESGLMVYAKGSELHYHLAYTQREGQAIYDFAVNIEDTNDLKYVTSQDARVRVVVVGRTAKGAKIEVEAGERGGDVIKLQRQTISDRATLERIAKEELKKLAYDGYRGEIQGWLVPYCAVGYAAIVRDDDYPAREGKYYVSATKVSFSEKGGIRKITPSIKLS